MAKVPPRRGAGAALRRPVPLALRPHLRRFGTDATRPWARAKARRARDPLRLHLACGANYKPGWVNIDLLGARVDIALNLARGLPFPDASVEAVFHEHYLEHLTLEQALALTAECHRVLRAGGVLRIGVPDAAACLRAYCGRGEQQWVASVPTPLLAVTELMYEHGHRSAWDAQTIDLLCRAAGFSGAVQRDFGGGELDPNVDSENRRGFTLYVEAPRQRARAPG